MRVYLNESNIGGPDNFNRALALSRGEFFKWAAHDDLMEPEFLARCVYPNSTEDPSVVLAYPRAMIIDDKEKRSNPTRFETPNG